MSRDPEPAGYALRANPPYALNFHAEPIQDDGEVEDTAQLACIALLGVCVGTNNLLGETAAGAKLQSSFDEWKVLWRNKAGR